MLTHQSSCDDYHPNFRLDILRLHLRAIGGHFVPQFSVVLLLS